MKHMHSLMRAALQLILQQMRTGSFPWQLGRHRQMPQMLAMPQLSLALTMHHHLSNSSTLRQNPMHLGSALALHMKQCSRGGSLRLALQGFTRSGSMHLVRCWTDPQQKLPLIRNHYSITWGELQSHYQLPCHSVLFLSLLSQVE